MRQVHFSNYNSTPLFLSNSSAQQLNSTLNPEAVKKHFNSLSLTSEPQAVTMNPVYSVASTKTFSNRIASILVDIVQHLDVHSQSTSTTSHFSCPVCDTISKTAIASGVSPNPIPDPVSLKSIVKQMLHVMMSVFGVHETELVQSISLFRRILSRHWNCAGFTILRNNIHALFLVCVVLAHKCSVDIPYKQASWANSFGVPPIVLNIFEDFCLKLVDWIVIPSLTDYESITSLLQNAESH
ncbi:hypothetical protein BLNAU_14975 [Blattamonas nauphoetae]|uniref:Uncharacterized protein n=1 Tax=Blattamonas nauphoetae TaxID=2049346 RepID=A0ABQ9XC22_9EUKA|nr:hypothetical protein BLNAU_14975 [Blattamonas nauphoetae]